MGRLHALSHCTGGVGPASGVGMNSVPCAMPSLCPEVWSQGGTHRVEADAVAQDRATPHQMAQLLVVRGIGGLEALVRTVAEGRLLPPAGDLDRTVGRHRPADPDPAQDWCPGGPLQEAPAAEPVSGLTGPVTRMGSPWSLGS